MVDHSSGGTSLLVRDGPCSSCGICRNVYKILPSLENEGQNLTKGRTKSKKNSETLLCMYGLSGDDDDDMLPFLSIMFIFSWASPLVQANEEQR